MEHIMYNYELVFDYNGEKDIVFSFSSSADHLEISNKLLSLLESYNMVAEYFKLHPDKIQNSCVPSNIRLFKDGTAVFPKPQDNNDNNNNSVL